MKSFIAIVLTVLTLSHSKPSQAGVGAIIANPPAMIAGLVLTGVGAGIVLIQPSNGGNGGWGALGDFMARVVFGTMLAGAGLIVLDSKEGQSLSFTALEAEKSLALGLTSQELAAFNAELDQANSLIEEVNSMVTADSSVEENAEAWESVKGLVSAETFSAMQKIAAQNL